MTIFDEIARRSAVGESCRVGQSAGRRAVRKGDPVATKLEKIGPVALLFLPLGASCLAQDADADQGECAVPRRVRKLSPFA